MSYSGAVSRGIQLAAALDERGFLNELFVPRYRRRLTPIMHGRVRTDLRFALTRKALYKWRGAKFFPPADRFFLDELLDKSVARRLRRGADLVVAESHIALHTIEKAKSYGTISAIDRTNTHIEYQTKILTEESDRWGGKHEIDPRVIDKAKQEYEAADYICVLSTYVKRTFIEQGVPEGKLVVIPSGVDTGIFKLASKEDDVFRVIFCGASCIRKGTHYLIEAFKELKLPNAELVLIGDIFEDIKPYLRDFDGWKALGFISYGELYRRYSQGSVFVLPSIEEGLSRVMLEAMACGLPVVSTDTGAADVVREGVEGFVVPIRDVEALKAKLLYLYEHEEARREMSLAAKSRIDEEFTLKRYVARAIEAYEQMISVASKPAADVSTAPGPASY